MTKNKSDSDSSEKTLTNENPSQPAAALPVPAFVTDIEIAFPIVGIGASAGGLGAFEAFFSAFPKNRDADMAFVLVQHLAPEHNSILPELIRHYTRMPVFEIEDGMVVRPNCIYVTPPKYDIALINGALQLLDPMAPRGRHFPINSFFNSLAQDQHERAIAIILSGTGNDGTQGARAIKAVGGIVIAQTPESAEFDGMPNSVIASGMADHQLAPAQMVSHLIAYVSRKVGNLVFTGVSSENESALKKVFILLRAQTGHDFSLYKPNTILRRIERRMTVHQVDSLDSYAKYLQQTPNEVVALFHDLLIGVTNFFRDPEVFLELEQMVIPQLFAEKSPGSIVRVWCVGCSTGEEAYSLAILLQERIELLRQNYSVQVFATDIDPRAISVSRAGFYPSSIAADLTPERLARFFTPEKDGTGYRVAKGIRDMLVFSEQNVVKDPPFSKIDLITCRNLMIYLGPELQQKLIPTFHYALNSFGMLFLGSSEGVGEFGALFSVLSRKAKIYQREEDFHGVQRAALGRALYSMPSAVAEMAEVAGVAGSAQPIHAAKPGVTKLPLRELTEQTLLHHLTHSAALVNERGDILYLHGRTGQYLEPPPGEAGISNILKKAREGLRGPLATALYSTVAAKQLHRVQGVRVKTNGHFTLMNLAVCPVVGESLGQTALKLYLVIFEEIVAQRKAGGPTVVGQLVSPPVVSQLGIAGSGVGDNETPDDSAGPELTLEGRIAELKEELRTKDDYLQSTHNALESANEELKSANEEMQSMNEELQSTNEELETSKEELQSVNEELATVNTELHTKLVDLMRINNDMNNLLAGTGVATIFVDLQLCLLRFTPGGAEIYNLIQTDIGRSLGHIMSNLFNYDSLIADVKSVLASLASKERQVETNTGRWFLMRIRPYRTLENVIEGAVITFTDIGEMKRMELALEKANHQLRLAVVVQDAYDAITVQAMDGRIIAWNPGATRLFGWSEAEALQMNAAQRIPPALREHGLQQMAELSRAEVLKAEATQRLSKTGATLHVWVTATALVNERQEVYAISTTERLDRNLNNHENLP